MTTKSKKLITKKPVWFITGCSTGFGRELAQHLLELGYRTVVTARHPETVADFKNHDQALVLKLDVTKQSQIEAAIKAAEEKFGSIDVLVNNAGIGYFAAVESLHPPHHLLLGNNAYDGAIAKINELRKEFLAWEAVSRSADFPKKTKSISK